MKRIIFLAVFVMAFVSAKAQYDENYGFYLNPHAGYAFGYGNGANIGLSFGYEFFSFCRLEADVAYRRLDCQRSLQATIGMNSEVFRYSRSAFYLGLGAGAVFFEDGHISPDIVYKAGYTCAIVPQIFELSVEYQGDALHNRLYYRHVKCPQGFNLVLRFYLHGR